MFRGLGTTIAREMPGYFFFFGGYEATRGLLTPAGKTKDEIGMKLYFVRTCHFILIKRENLEYLL